MMRDYDNPLAHSLAATELSLSNDMAPARLSLTVCVSTNERLLFIKFYDVSFEKTMNCGIVGMTETLWGIGFSDGVKQSRLCVV
jgi:hypothetical protein